MKDHLNFDDNYCNIFDLLQKVTKLYSGNDNTDKYLNAERMQRGI